MRYVHLPIGFPRLVHAATLLAAATLLCVASPAKADLLGQRFRLAAIAAHPPLRPTCLPTYQPERCPPVSPWGVFFR